MMRRYTYNNIVKAARLLSLVVLIAFGAGLKGWGQQTQTIIPTLPEGGEASLSGSTEIIYAMPGEKKDIYFQYAYVPDNLNGFIWWRLEDGTNSLLEKSGQLSDSPNGYYDYSTLSAYSNGFAWFRGKEGLSSISTIPASACMITYDTPDNFTEHTVICDASSLTNYSVDNDNNSIIAPLTTIRRKYVIKNAEDRRSQFNEFRNLVSTWEGGKDWLGKASSNLPESFLTNKASFPENYEIHTPMVSDDGTSYRLAQILSNYYVGENDVPVEYVRWRMYNQNLELASGTANKVTSNGVTVLHQGVENFAAYRNNNPANIISYKFDYDESNTDKQQIFYITAEISSDQATWYPVSFLTVYLEPNATPVPKTTLNSAEYEFRTQEYINARYIEIAKQDFDDVSKYANVGKDLSADTNYPDHPLVDAQSYYAYAYPNMYQSRAHSLRSVGSGEYGIYRTLNYTLGAEDISDAGWYGVQNNYPFKYQAWFTNNYNYYITDRLYDEESKYGNFLYVDAADEAGVITKLSFSESLCPNTRLVVTAWICSMSENRDGRTDADLGLTFKGVRSDDTEVILHKFYTGSVTCNPISDNGYWNEVKKANWQQVYFSFNFSANEDTYKNFILEIANNCRHSDGADYAIDDIRIYRSLPNIEVIRLDACEADSLTVSSDYHTLLRNMAYSENSITVTDWNSVVRRTGNADESEIIDVELLKYRLGLNGAPMYGENSDNFLTKTNFESYIFNSYFSFVEGLDDSRPDAVTHDITSVDNLDAEELNPILLGPTDLETGENAGKDVYRWVRINKGLSEFDPRVVFSYRTIVTTRAPEVVDNNVINYPTTHEEAVKWERVFNLRALQDYNYLCNSWESFKDKLGSSIGKPDWLINEITIQSDIFGEYLSVSDLSKIKDLAPMNTEQANTYDELMKTFWSRLDIPRIRVPWYDKDNDIMYLYTVDVRNTDLKSQGELVIEQDGTQKEATGQYHVVLQSASAIASGIGRTLNLKDICTLISPFTLYGSIQITVEAETDLSARACAGTQRKISAQLLSKDDGEPLTGVDYSFDWFLGGGYEKYWEISVEGYDLKSMLAAVRDDESFLGEITYANVNSWNPSSDTNQKIREKLLDLLNPEDAKLVTNKTEFSWLLSADSLVAMPFVTKGAANTSYCTEITAAPVPLYSTDVPELHPGFTLNGIISPFEGEVSLRLGRVNMGVNLAVPMQAGFEKSMAESASSLGLSDKSGVPIMLNNIEAQYPEIGKATDMLIMRDATDGTVTIQLNEEAKTYLQEGQRYELLIPFVQYDGFGQPLASECDGLISLPVKIVPEYLTWKGESADNWYDESKWNQSTKKELYFNGWDGTGADIDANGSDDVTKAFSPLYFTKITIPEEKELVLESPDVSSIKVGSKIYDVLNSWTSEGDGSDSIRYEMAVANANGDIVPYYINKVDQIYFKPEATLMNQHYLDYQKAWVDFEMEAGKPYWMSSPLKGVYAGDMYAPSSNGRQETKAFTDITYSGKNEGGNTNSRWSPAFYQKAWNKAIAYVTEGSAHDVNNATDVAAVQSNWSIEYNDVWVPYSVGKGFYARVEDLPEANTSDKALVRLPKADKQYSYETKAAGNLSNGENISRDNANDLMDKVEGETGKDIVIALDTEVDGDGTHFLVGNPYMTYLDMEKFFEVNDNLEKKFWTLNRTATSVGTPDVTWTGYVDGDIQSYVAPMTAFFVELSDNVGDDKTIEFTTAMMAAKPTTTDNVYTKSYSASNPILTLTAERGKTRSVARLLTSDKGHDAYEASEDAVLLLDSELDAPMVYTVAGDVAAQFNTIQSIRNVPLGVYAAKGEEVELTIRGISQFADKLYLYDALTKQSTPLDDDSYTFRVTGPSHGRFTLTSQNRISAESDICVYSPIAGQLLVMSSPEEALQRVQVYDMSGRMVVSRDNIRNTTCQLSLASGIYIVYAENESGNVRVKIRIR